MNDLVVITDASLILEILGEPSQDYHTDLKIAEEQGYTFSQQDWYGCHYL